MKLKRIRSWICRRWGHKETVGNHFWARAAFCKRCGKWLWTVESPHILFLDGEVHIGQGSLTINEEDDG